MEQVKQHSLKAWWLAARPKTLSAGLIAVITASALAFSDGAFDWCKALLCVAFAACMQIAANMINDLYDYLRGTDGEERLGPRRACAQGWISPRAMRGGIAVMLLLAGVFGVGLLLTSSAPWLLLPCPAPPLQRAPIWTALSSLSLRWSTA